jgi:predicted KAP-like P-loop ATPase
MADNMASHPFSADRPITSRSADLLGRGAFAESLASAIRGWKDLDSLVIALYGPWGAGKSLIKNMMLEALRGSKEDCPSIVEFNPWQWMGPEHPKMLFLLYRWREWASPNEPGRWVKRLIRSHGGLFAFLVAVLQRS